MSKRKQTKPPSSAAILKDVPRAISAATKRFKTDEVLVRASSLAFSSMLAIIPIGAVSLSLLSNFASFHEQAEKLKALIIKTVLPGIGNSLSGYIDSFIANANTLSVIGVAGLIFSSALLMYEIHATFDKLFGAYDEFPVREKLLEFWAILTGLPFAILSVFSISSSLLEKYGLHAGDIFLSLEPYLMCWVGLLIILFLFSPKKTTFLATLIGASFGSVLYMVAQFVFIEYISVPIIPNMLYGALAVVPLLMFWLLIIWTLPIRFVANPMNR